MARVKRFFPHPRSSNERSNQIAKDENVSAEEVMRDIRCQTRRKYSVEDKIRIVLEGLRGEESIAELCRRKHQPKCELQVEGD